MVFFSSSQLGGGQRHGMPGGGIGCLIFGILAAGLGFLLLRGLYKLAYFLTPVLLVAALVIHWKVFPDTLRDWFKSLKTNPLGAVLTAVAAVVFFPLLSVYLLLRALGTRQLNRMREQFGVPEQPKSVGEEYVDFEEIESRPKRPSTVEELPLEPLDGPPAQAPRTAPPPKPGNPYDQLFD